MKSKHPILRWIKRIVLGFVGLVLLGVGGALAALHTDWGRDILRQQVEKQMATTFTGGATIGKIEGSPFGDPRNAAILSAAYAALQAG